MKTYLSVLKEFVKFKSISTDRAYKSEIENTVNWLKVQFESTGFGVEIIRGYDNPLILANFIVNEKLPTVLVYGHYDVQPAEKSDGWKKDPFSLHKDSKRYYARGVIDNKGQVLVHIATVFDLIKSKKLKYNVKFIIEGDEETGSKNIEKFIKKNKNKLKADFVLISDGELSADHACLDSSFRGIVNFTLKITTSGKDNHSGLYGGSIPNASHELIKLLAKIHNEDRVLTIKGVNNFKKIEEGILKNNKGLPYSQKEFLKITGAKKRLNEKNFDFYTQTGFLTSAEVTTVNAGYQGEGYKNAIPGFALAKINFRIAPPLTVPQTKKLFKNFIKENAPDYIDFEVIPDQSSEGFVVETKNKLAQNTKKLLKQVYKKEVFDRPCGAIIPIVGYFIKYIKAPAVSVGLANEDCNMHAVDENFSKEALTKGLKFSKLFFSK